MNTTRPDIQASLSDFADADLATGANAILAALGYTSTKTEPLPSPDAKGFARAFDHTFSKTAQIDQWKQLELLFQLTSEELGGRLALQSDAFEPQRISSFLFFALDLKREAYARGALANMARELSKPFPMPVVVLFRYGTLVSLASLHRRQNKNDSNRDVLERVVLLKDIRLQDPHPAHIRILQELSSAQAGTRDWKGFLDEWNRVLDISELNKKFYLDYKAVFDQAEQAAILPSNFESKRRDWTQRLFNRLLFLRFLEKKGWLQFHGSKKYLRTLFEASRSSQRQESFLNDRLYWLFFQGLNTANEDASVHNFPDLKERRGEVPFLNGGLFDLEDLLDVKDMVKFEQEDTVFASILDLFDRYYFTVDESTLHEEEVGIDPEMLGKVFEELVTGRHETGSYYTPRGIVSFMAREALKGYLAKFEQPGAIASFVDEGDATQISDPERILTALREVTICDPACGSGAYLLGMMQELLRLREALFVAKAKDHDKIYDRKLEIIAQNLYGVDKDNFAASITKLRLWLSLIIEYEGATPPPLPNLKYKIEAGDSLSAPLGQQLTLDTDIVSGFNQLKRDYVKAHLEEKERIEQAIEIKRSQLKVYSSAPLGSHDWRTEFAEVFENGGFDIVLANPPYVRMELFKDQKSVLKKNFPAAHSDRADLYIYFYERGFELLKQDGILAYISPNKWLLAGYGSNLRQHIALSFQVTGIIDFGDLPVFQSAIAYPMIFLGKKAQNQSDFTFTKVQTLDPPYPDIREIIQDKGSTLPAQCIQNKDWRLSESNVAAGHATMRSAEHTLGSFIKDRIYRGVVTGSNHAFFIDGVQRKRLIDLSPKCEEVIQPLVLGRDIRRWKVDKKDRWLIYMHHGISTEGLGPILDHLSPFRESLERRATKQHWYELQQPQRRYLPVFQSRKIIYQEIATFQAFALDTEGVFTNNKCFFIGSDELYLLGILNSSPVWSYLQATCPKLNGGALSMQKLFLSQLPIPAATQSDKGAIESLVERCLQVGGRDCAEEEAEINARVTKLYGIL